MHWKFFCGSSILVGGLLVKSGAPLTAVALGILIAAVVRRTTATHSNPQAGSGH